MTPRILGLVLVLAACQSRPAVVPADWPLVFAEDFERETPRAFVYSDDEAFRVRDDGSGNHVLALDKRAAYIPEVRSPHALALIDDLVLGDFVLDADLLQTGRDYGHRDMCVFFGVQAKDRFYYLHLASAADAHAHNLFRVAERPRVKFANKTTRGVDWGRGVWHHVRIVRRAATGVVLVYFDDMVHPIMQGKDRRFARGQVGFGSFDDTGLVDNIRIWAPGTGHGGRIRF